MRLIGQYDSPFVRRVGIALTLYRLPFEHVPWSVFRDADKLATVNPLVRVPTLVLDDGTALIESHVILDYIDGLVPPTERLFPVVEPSRHQAMRLAELAVGAADKAVSLFYEGRLHSEVSDVWVARCRMQINGALAALERELASGAPSTRRIGHAEIAIGCATRFIRDVHGATFDWLLYPSVARLADTLEATPAFQAIQQPFNPPA
jgi:glutathione S-transferase